MVVEKLTGKRFFERKIEEDEIRWIRDKFIHGDLVDGKKIFRSIDELVDIHNESKPEHKKISKQQIYKYSGRENWKQRKTIILNKLEEEREEKELRQILSVSSNLEAIALQNITKIHKITELYLENYAEIFGDEYESPFKDKDINDLPPINPKDLSMLVSSIEKLLNIQYKILGEDDFKSTVYKEIKALEKDNHDSENDELISTLKSQLNELENEQKKLDKQNGKKQKGRPKNEVVEIDKSTWSSDYGDMD